MKVKVLVGIGILLLVGIGVKVFGQKEISQPLNQQLTEQTVLSSQTNSEGSVTLEVTPQITSDSFGFDVTMDTHSGDLVYDLTKLAVLEDDNGNEYMPTGWQGDPPGGHHRTGTLEFLAISPRPSSIELVIRDIDGVRERKFIWNLKEE